MPRRLWLAAAMLATGSFLVVSAQLAGAAAERKGGVFRVGTTGASVQVDPQLAYITTAWWLEYATAAKLYNHPDKRGAAGTLLQPEVASRYRVSNGGKRYTFFIRKGFRFSDGTPVRAKHFKHAINRAANKELASPGAQFITDENGTNIVGAQAVNNGQGTDVRGVQVRGNRLIINLTRPDGTFMSKITMPFFQATHTKLALNQRDRERQQRTRPAVGRPVHLHAERRQHADLDPAEPVLGARAGSPSASKPERRRRPLESERTDRVPPSREWRARPGTPSGGRGAERGEPIRRQQDALLVDAHELHRLPTPEHGERSLQGQSEATQGDQLRRRPRRLRRCWRASYAGQPWSRLLSPIVLGPRAEQPYPPSPDLARARALAAGHFRDGKITVYYRSSGTTNQAQAQIVRQDLINLGFQPDNITMKGFSGGNIYTAWPSGATTPT